MTPGLDIDAIVARVKEEIQADALKGRMEQELAKIDEQLAQINADSSLKEAEKNMHLAFLNFNRARTELAYTDLEKAKDFEKAETAFNKDNSVSAIRINPQGNAVIELRVPESKLGNFDGLLNASQEYWEELTRILEDIK